MPSAGFEAAISAIERLHNYALDFAVTGTAQFICQIGSKFNCLHDRDQNKASNTRQTRPLVREEAPKQQWLPWLGRSQPQVQLDTKRTDTLPVAVACTWSRSDSYKSNYQQSPEQLPHSHRTSVSDPIEMVGNKHFARTALKKCEV